MVTSFGLWAPPPARGEAPVDPDRSTLVRTGWHEIHKVTWSGDELAVTPGDLASARDGYQVLVDGPVRRFILTEPGRVPEQVRLRMTRSVGYTVHEDLPGGGGVRVVGRRITGRDGLHWAVRYDPGTDADAPGVVESTGELVERARAHASSRPLP